VQPEVRDSESFADFDAFETNVRMRVELDSSHVQFADIALFAPDLQGVEFPLDLSGKFRGTISELKGRDMRHHLRGRIRLQAGTPRFTGLPDVRQHLHADRRGAFPYRSLVTWHNPAGTTVHRARPLAACRWKSNVSAPVSFEGNFTGFPRAFTASGRAVSAARSAHHRHQRMSATPSATCSNSEAVWPPRASISVPLRAIPPWASSPCDVKVRGSGRSFAAMTAELEGTVPELHVEKLNIGGITLKGRLEKNLFNGVLHCDDPQPADGLRWPRGPARQVAQSGLLRGHTASSTRAPSASSVVKASAAISHARAGGGGARAG
jgi:hypothetical protein